MYYLLSTKKVKKQYMNSYAYPDFIYISFENIYMINLNITFYGFFKKFNAKN
jgi:hypothetical protein